MSVDFKHSLRGDDNMHTEYTIPAMEIKWFDPIIHRQLKKHLADFVYHAEGNPKRDRDLEMADIYERIDPSEKLT